MKQYKYVTEEVEENSNMITPIGGVKNKDSLLTHSDVVLIPVRRSEKPLLTTAGLNIENDNCDVYFIKDHNGELKGAISINHIDNNNKKINYIDVDESDTHFKQGIVKLAISPYGYSLQSSKVEIIKDKIDNNLIDQ